jgi:threonine dehydrogenase-like Zn-dependent dehydrogenase
VKALVFERKLARFGAAIAVTALRGSAGTASRVGPLSFADRSEPAIPGPGWHRVAPRLAGICGSDLATVTGASSRWFEPIVSFPFVPGHEVVGTDDAGRRVVIEPVLGCVARGITPACAHCAAGDLGRCERITFGHLQPGLQSGFCCDTGGGWSTSMVAHESQLHAVPDDLSDEDAVMVEPAACAIHAALLPGSLDGAAVAVIGAGTLGLLTTAAIHRWNTPSALVVGAKHADQQRIARSFGATAVVEPGEIVRAVRRVTGSLAVGDGDIERLTGGADVTFDCVGSAQSIDTALRMTRPGGRIVLVGMAGVTKVDLTPLWHREISLQGAYAYGTEAMLGGRRTFDAAFELSAARSLGSLVSARYPLDRCDDAIAHAAGAGRRGAVKVVFDLRGERR